MHLQIWPSGIVILTPPGGNTSALLPFGWSGREPRKGTADRRVDGGGRLELKFVQERERSSLLGSQAMCASKAMSVCCPFDSQRNRWIGGKRWCVTVSGGQSIEYSAAYEEEREKEEC